MTNVNGATSLAARGVRVPRGDPEIKAENKYAKTVKKDGCICIKMNLHGRRGYPDRLTIYPNGSFFTEFKRTDTDLEPLQTYIHNQLREMGYGVFTAHTYEEAISIYKAQRYNTR